MSGMAEFPASPTSTATDIVIRQCPYVPPRVAPQESHKLTQPPKQRRKKLKGWQKKGKK